MHVWGAVDFRICLAPKNHGYKILAQSYDFYLHLAQLVILEFTLSLIHFHNMFDLECTHHYLFCHFLIFLTVLARQRSCGKISQNSDLINSLLQCLGAAQKTCQPKMGGPETFYIYHKIYISKTSHQKKLDPKNMCETTFR